MYLKKQRSLTYRTLYFFFFWESAVISGGRSDAQTSTAFKCLTQLRGHDLAHAQCDTSAASYPTPLRPIPGTLVH